MVLRSIHGAGALGGEDGVLSCDSFGSAGGVVREGRGLWGAASPAHIGGRESDFLPLDRARGTAEDTTAYAARMAQRCSAAVVLRGGDGTKRAAARGLGDVPMHALSTGTNNAFPVMMEATVAGMALGLIATGKVGPPTERAKLLHVEVTRADGRRVHEVALVDVCVNTIGEIGSRALWTVDTLRELYCTFAEPHSIGLSSIPGRIRPTGRSEPHGVAVRLCPSATAGYTVLAPIAPGLLEPVGVETCDRIEPGAPLVVELDRGTVALDGEREVEFGPGDRITVTLAADGPRVIDVPAVLVSTTSCLVAQSY